MITTLLAWLLIQSLMQIKLIESIGVPPPAPLIGRNGFTGSEQVSHSWKKTKKRETKTHIHSSKSSSYVIVNVDNTENESSEGVQMSTIVLIEQQMTTQLNKDQSSDDGSSNNTDMTDGDDSDFEVANDDTTSSVDNLILTEEEDEEENIPSSDDNDVVGEILNIDSESDSNNDDNNDNTDDNEYFTADNDNLVEGVDDGDEERSDKNNSKSISELKKLWRNLILTAKNDQLKERSQEILSAVQHQINENSSITGALGDIENYRNVPLSSILSQFPILLRANGTDSASFNRQLESQLHDPLALGQRALWLDQEFALVLKGENVTIIVIS